MSAPPWAISEILSQAGVKQPELERVLWWAFGYGYKTVPLSAAAHNWNHIHGDLFIIADHDLVQETMLLILEFYRKRFGWPMPTKPNPEDP